MPRSARHAPASPLTPEERHRAQTVARRLRAEFRRLLAALPAATAGASGLARALNTDRATCQRLLFALRVEPDAQILLHLPGVQGLRQFVNAARAAGAPDQDAAAADAAIDQFDALISSLAGSRARLAARLRATTHTDPANDPITERARRQVFTGAAEVTGRASDVNVTIYIYRPTPGDPATFDRLMATGVIGHTARPDAVPLVISTGRRASPDDPAAPVPYATLDQRPATGRTPGAVLEEFSTSPPPAVTARGPGDQLLQIIDPAATAGGRPIDLVVALRSDRAGPHPALDKPPVQEVWTLMHYPARALLFDVFLHRTLARACIPSLAMHLWRPNLETGMGDRWYTQLPSAPTLQLLGPGLARSPTPLFPRHAELTAHLFDRAGWPAAEFIGFRCALTYPLWRAGYCMTFDFAEHD